MQQTFLRGPLDGNHTIKQLYQHLKENPTNAVSLGTLCMQKSPACTVGSTAVNWLFEETAHRPRNYHNYESFFQYTCIQTVIKKKKLTLVGNVLQTKKLSAMKLRRGGNISNSNFYIKMIELQASVYNILKTLKPPLKFGK